MDERARLDLVQRENDELRERVALLERVLCQAERPFPFEWALTASEARVFGVLVSREMATKDAIMAGLYGSRLKDEAEEKIVDVFICKLRKKLGRFGIQIRTHWGQGFSLAAPERARFRSAA